MRKVKLKHGQSGKLKIGDIIEVTEDEAKTLVDCGTFEDVTKDAEKIQELKEGSEETAEDPEATTTKKAKK